MKFGRAPTTDITWRTGLICGGIIGTASRPPGRPPTGPAAGAVRLYGGRGWPARPPCIERMEPADALRRPPPTRPRGRVDRDLPRGRGRARTARAAVLGRQGLGRPA